MGLEAARANVQAALHREANESRKAWAKRKTKAVATFVAEKMVDARLPVIHPSVTTLQVKAFSQMANVGGNITFDTCASSMLMCIKKAFDFPLAIHIEDTLGDLSNPNTYWPLKFAGSVCTLSRV